MTRTYTALAVLVLSLLPRYGGAAGLPTFDAALNALGIQQQWLQIKEFYEMVQHTANQVRQIENQIKQIESMAMAVAQGAQNLQHFSLNNASNLLGLVSQMDSKLNQAAMLGYQAQTVATQAQGLYARLEGVVDGRELAALQQRWAGAQRESALVAVQVQAIQQQHQQRMQQIAAILTTQTQGNLDTQQAAVQMQGLVVTQLVSVEQQLATMGRLQAVQQLDTLARDEAERASLRQFFGEANVSGAPGGHILSLR